jgi:methyl-accepting chemotaxis protein
LDALDAGLVVLGAGAFALFGPSRLGARMQEMTELIRTLAEGEGNLKQRLDTARLGNDETGDMGRWINSFLDSLDGIVGQVIQVTTRVRQDNDARTQQRGGAHHTRRCRNGA